MRRRSLSADLILGAVAGAIATYVMDKVTTVLYEREPDEVKEAENKARGEMTAYEIAAKKAAELAGVTLSDEKRKRLASAIHWSVGISSGTLYGLLRHSTRLRIGSGLAYGFVFFLAVDEAALTLLGLTPPPGAFPWQAHARGLAGHLVLGAMEELPFDVADSVRS
jgi:uncharacterized membrane protein YagU involved in acid resistance